MFTREGLLMFYIKQVKYKRKKYLPLLLLADPSEKMIDLYFEKGEMFVLNLDGEIVCEAVIVIISDSECELKNLATSEQYQNKGYAKKLVNYLLERYKRKYKIMSVGTTELTSEFYKKLGFEYSHIVKDFFKDNYPKPIIENNILCSDMLYLKINL